MPNDLVRGEDRLMTSGEVARIFAVSPKTVSRWATDGLIQSTLTPGGHRRFRESDIRTMLGGERHVDQD